MMEIDKEINKIVKFCEKNETSEVKMKIKCSNDDGKITFKARSYSFLDQYYLPESSVKEVNSELSKRASAYTYIVNKTT